MRFSQLSSSDLFSFLRNQWKNLDKSLAMVLAFALAFRLLLLFINADANDDHIEPILMWMKNAAFPQVHDCWECFQPPLFSGFIKTISQLFNLTEYHQVRILFQFVNFIASLLILLIIIDSHLKLNLNRKFRLALIAFWALNPKLIAIGSQATNDTIIIFLGMAFSILLFRYLLTKWTISGLLLVSLIALVAAASKGTGLTFVIILILALIYGLFTKQKRSIKIAAMAVIVSLPVLVASVGGYYEKYQNFGNPFIINQNKAAKPAWFNDNTGFMGRKGVSTISETFLSFNMLSLVKEPYNVNQGQVYPMHRESFWTQLYGQFSNALFERHPGSWISIHPDMLNIARINYILLLPLFLFFIYSFTKATLFGIKELFRTNKLSSDLLHSLFILTLLVFTIKYSYDYRDFSNMKVIFIFPALYSMFWIFQRGFRNVKFVPKVLCVFIWLVTAGYAINLSFLVIQLW